MSPEDPKNIDKLREAMIDAALDEAASVRASRGETGKGKLSPLAGADNPDFVVQGASVDTAASSVTTEAGAKMISGKIDLEGKKEKQEEKNAGKNGTGRRRGGRGKGGATAKDKEPSAPAESPVREDSRAAVTEDPDVDVSGMRNPFGSRARKGSPLDMAQEEMDALARGEMPNIPVEEPVVSQALASVSPVEGSDAEKSNYEKIRKLGGLQGRYKVSGSSDKDGGWEIVETDFDTGLMDLRKFVVDQDHQKTLFKYGVSIDELVKWNKSLETVAPEPPVLTNEFKSGEQVRNEAESRKSSAEIISGEMKEEPLDQKIARLKSEAEGLRAAYAKADYDETNAWARVKKFFGKTLKGIDEREWQEKQYDDKKESYRDGIYWQAQYQNTLVDLKSAELERIKSHASEGKGWKKEMADMIKYFDLDEKVELIDARTQYRRGKQNWPTKIFDSIGAAGRLYNSVPLKYKMMITAALAGATIASVASGGLATGAMATALVGARRVFASAGLAVGTEALLDSSRKTYQAEETEKEIERLFGETPEKGFDFLEAEMQKKVFAMDDELQKAKLTKLLHKAGALTVGIAVGSGWLSQIVMDKLGGGEAIDWVREQFNGNGGDVLVSGAVPLSSTIEAPDAPSAPPLVSDVPPETPDVQSLHEVPETSDFPIESENPTGAEEAPASSSAAESAAEAGVGAPDTIDTFLSQENIPIEKGDSVWGIAGRLANELGLEEGSPQSTRFINTLKEQIGDVQLRAGETINFSAHGIDKEFIENALQDANTLSPEQLASIAENDARIAEFAAANPDVTLTNESVDAILRDGAETATPPEGLDELPPETDGSSSAVEESADKEGFKSADINSERDIVFGKEYNLKNYTEYFRQNPEEFAKFKNLGDQYFAYIFPGNPDDLKTIGSMKISDFHSDSNQVTDDLHQFMQLAKEAYGSKLGLPSPKEKVYEYVARMAMLGIEHPTGKRIIFPQYV